MIEENSSIRNWLVELAGDGSHDSFWVAGTSEDIAQAFKAESVEEYIEDLYEEANWDMYGCFNLSLEQGYIRVTPVRRFIKV